MLAPVLDLLPSAPCHALDIGAGTGRDAAWLTEQGHQVLAVEPVEALRRAGEALHAMPRLRWLNDRLPALDRIGESFDLILAVAVVQHLPPDQQRAAARRLVHLLAPGDRLILSLRHGPGAPNRPCFATDPDAIVAAANADGGVALTRRVRAESVQPANRAAGVTWTWLCFCADEEEGRFRRRAEA